METGDELGGRYRLSRRLGQGGMGEVWAAHDDYLNRQVAIKIVLAGRSADPHFAERLRREARTAASLKHPGITEVHDFGHHDGAPFFVMELLNGRSFETLLDEHPSGLPAVLAVSLMAKVAEALAYAHDRGVVHRDIKPANLMHLADGGVKICDFGISRDAEATGGLTMPGSVIGTPAFMAPEQWRGEPTDSRADVYAFGITLHSLLTGARPFPGPSPEEYRYQHLNTPPPRLRDLRAGLPAELDDLLQRLLAKFPDKRTTTASQVAANLHSIRDQLAEHPPAKQTPLRRPSRRSIVVAGLGVAAIAGASVTPLLLSTEDSASKHPPREPDTTVSSARTGTPVTLYEGGEKAVQGVAFSPDGKTLVSVGDDGVARLWKVAAKALAKTFTHKVTNPWTKPLAQVTEFNPQFTAAMSAAFSPDGANLAVGNGDGTVSLWNVATGADTVLPYLDPVLWNSSPSCVAFDPDGGTLAATYTSPAVRLWNLATRTSSATLITGRDYWVGSTAFSPLGGLLATASGNGNPGNKRSDGLLQLWDPSSRETITTLAHTNTDRNCLAFSLDGATLANVRNDGTIALWNVTSRKITATLAGPGSGVTCIAFGPDAILASGSSNGTVGLWDTKSRKSLTALNTGTDTKINCVSISPDGKTVASGGSNLTVWTIK
ncbi:WD40 repeat domain-containing serine/threonine protein kinase [Streptomyces sp. NPDC059627]